MKTMAILYKTKEVEDDFKPVISKMPHLHELADAMSSLSLDVLISRQNIGCVWCDRFNVVNKMHKAYVFSKYEGTNELGALVSRDVTRISLLPVVDELERRAANVLMKMSGQRVFWSLPKRKEQTTLGYREVSETVHVLMPTFSSAEELKLKLELMK